MGDTFPTYDFESKYNQGELDNKLEILQCQGEKDYLNIPKDCDNCDDSFKCHTMKAKPFEGVTIYHGYQFVFAENKEDAEGYISEKHGWSSDLSLEEIGVIRPVTVDLNRKTTEWIEEGEG